MRSHNQFPNQDLADLSGLPWWRHQTETFSALLAFCGGINRWPVNSPHKSQWHGTLVFSLIWACTNGWVNNWYAGDLRHHPARYDVIMTIIDTHYLCSVMGMNYLTWQDLTHWGRDKMAAISQTTLSNAFSWMKMLEFWLKFHWSLFPMV